MMQAIQTSAQLPREEWDFDNVPDSELVACYWWEYARESKTIRELRQEILEKWGDGSIHHAEYTHRLSAVWCDSFRASQIFPFILVSPPSNWRREQDPWAASRPQDAVLEKLPGRSFPGSWQSLSPAERAELGKLFDRKATPGEAFKREQLIHPRNLFLEYCNLRPQYLRKGSKQFSSLDSIECAVGWANPRQVWRSEKPSSEDGEYSFPNRILFPSGMEYTLVEIDWGQFTNDELVEAFRRWVKANRPIDVPRPDGRGRGPRATRAELTDAALETTHYGGKPNYLTKRLTELRSIPIEGVDGLDEAALKAKRRDRILTAIDRMLEQYDWKEQRCSDREEAEETARQAADVLPSSDVLDKILRYETTLNRQLYQAIHQLERLQRRRMGEAVPPPISMEVAHTT